jgi:hypothetical protein
MNRIEATDHTRKAEGYFELGMFSESWETLESINASERASSPVLEIRLRILTALSQWDLGEQIASVLIHSGEKAKRTVSRFHHARSRVFYQTGDFTRARAEIRKAVDAWADIRKELSDDDLTALLAE